MSKSKPKIAFCFSWQARTLDQTYLFFQKNLFDAAKEQWFDYDVFCAVEDDEDVDKVNLLNPTKVEKIKSSEVEKIIEEKWWDFIRHELYKYWYFVHTWVYSLLQQIYKTQRSITLSKNGNYDLFFRLRFDTIYFNKFNFNYILCEVKKWWIICNNSWIHSITGHLISYLKITDLYFIWWYDMKIFTKIFDDFKYVVVNHKTYLSLNPIYKLIFWVNTIVQKLQKRFLITLPTAPLNILSRILWLQVFVWDSYYYKFLYNTKLIKTNIWTIILRKNVNQSDIRLSNKSQFEI